MSQADHTIAFDRRGTKKRKHMMFSRELIGVLDALVDEGRESREVEEAAWSYLVAEYGEEAVMAAVVDVQEGLSPDERLREPKGYEIPVR